MSDWWNFRFLYQDSHSGKWEWLCSDSLTHYPNMRRWVIKKIKNQSRQRTELLGWFLDAAKFETIYGGETVSIQLSQNQRKFVRFSVRRTGCFNFFSTVGDNFARFSDLLALLFYQRHYSDIRHASSLSASIHSASPISTPLRGALLIRASPLS